MSEKILREHQQAMYQLLEEFDRVCQKLNITYSLFAGTMLGAVRHEGFIPWDDDLDVILLRRDYEKILQYADKYIDKEKFFLQKEFSEHWPMFYSKLRLNQSTCLEKYHPKDKKTHQGVYIDIFPCDNAANSNLGRKIQFCASKVIIAKSLHERGYDTDSLAKKIFIGLTQILPKNIFLSIVKNKNGNSKYVHSFLGAASKFEKNVYPREWFDGCINLKFENRDFPVFADYDKLLEQLYGDYMRIPSFEERKIKQHAILVDLTKSYECYEHYRDNMSFEIYTRSIR